VASEVKDKELKPVSAAAGKMVMGSPVERFEPRPGQTKKDIIDDFHKLSYSAAFEEGLTWQHTKWLGVPMFKMPQDLLTLTEVIGEVKPHLIIETGTAAGGSALFMATYFDAIGAGKIVTVDIRPVDRNYPAHPRIAYLGGRSSLDAEVLAEVQGYWDFYANTMTTPGGPVMVILDSDHAQKHVARELDAYAHFVTPGSYLVVEDTNVNGHPVLLEHGPGPYEALEEWLPNHPEFKIDHRIASYQLFSQHTWVRKSRG
jgi:cephalosporin hydroxylase